MAQTKRKRRTKHRGNAAGMIEARGRTGRKPTSGEKKLDAKAQARRERLDRLNQPPTWRASANRAGIATIVFVAALLLLFHSPVGQVAGLAGFIFLLYIPLGYYTDLILYRRRQAKKAQEKK